MLTAYIACAIAMSSFGMGSWQGSNNTYGIVDTMYGWDMYSPGVYGMYMNTLQEATVNYGPNWKYSGYLVRPPGRGPFPAVVVVGNGWGINDDTKREAQRLARNGYVALAPDLMSSAEMADRYHTSSMEYGTMPTTTTTTTTTEMTTAGVPTTSTTTTSSTEMGTGSLMAARQYWMNYDATTPQLLAAAEYLRWRMFVKPDRVGAVGYGSGGAEVLALARTDQRLGAAVNYYGQPIPGDVPLTGIRTPIMAVYGEADTTVRVDDARDFQTRLGQANVTNEFYTYPEAGADFANPSDRDMYRANDTMDARRKQMEFLDRNLKH